ncbi:hypothetical protein BD626DRAFT_573596 [Schizophyllum amplum]|uniref:Uncharacterized protein n=1 Tax=Schizophyllum amplum TaxID=97359 RepID=A0A550C0Q0_9AGAR|nr:hypothetical protein BD626DRAFT_573596 [Auriculariopsis ampla]
MAAEQELPAAQRPRLNGDASNTHSPSNTPNVKREVSPSGAQQVAGTRQANAVASSSARQLSPPHDTQRHRSNAPGRILRPRPLPSIPGSQISLSPAPPSRRSRKDGRTATGGTRNGSTSTPPPRPKRGPTRKTSSTATAGIPQPQNAAAAPTTTRQPRELHAGPVEPANYKMGPDDDGKRRYEQLDPGDFVYLYRLDGKVPDPSFNFPVVDNGQDSESDPELDDSSEPENTNDAEQDVKSTYRSRRWWARRGCMTVPPLHEVAVNRARVDGPAYHKHGARRGLPRPDGAVVTRFLGNPGDLQHANMKALIRCPEHLEFIGQKDVITRDEIKAKLNRIVVQTEHNGLVIKNDNERKVPCMVPMDYTDLWSRYAVADEQSDIILDVMCLNDGLCSSTPSCHWNPSVWCQVRWCRRCENFMHVSCLMESLSLIHNLAFYADSLDKYEQSYLRYLLQEHEFAPDEPPRMPFGFDYDPDLADDTTWAEVAALPIRRRTFPTEAPETNEVVIQHAIQQVLDGRGGDVVPDVREWLHGIAPQAGLRAAKTILNKNLRQLRHGKDLQPPPPAQLLCVSRTNKTLRGALMRKSARWIWRASFQNDEDIPPVPTDLNEPQYARLLFDNSCMYCPSRFGTHVAWAARVRCCAKCLEDQFMEHDDLANNHNTREIVENCVPIYKHKDRGIIEQLEMMVKVHLARQRREAIYQKLCESGWGEQLQDPEADLRHHQLVYRPRRLTQRGWKNIEPN